jgi:hypothetical protein
MQKPFSTHIHDYPLEHLRAAASIFVAASAVNTCDSAGRALAIDNQQKIQQKIFDEANRLIRGLPANGSEIGRDARFRCLDTIRRI